MNRKNIKEIKISPYILKNSPEMEQKIYGLLSCNRDMNSYTDKEISALCRFFLNLKNYSNQGDKFPERLKLEAENRGINFKRLLN